MITRTVIDVLLEQKIITQAQLLECKTQADEKGISVEECLLEKNYITPDDLARARASLAGLLYVEKITEAMADLTTLAKIPLKFLRDNTVIPIIIDGQLTILTTDPSRFQPLDEVNMLLGGNARYAVASEKTIVDAINRYYPLEGSKQMIAAFEKEEEMTPEEVDFGAIEEKDIMAMASEAPIIKLVNNILFQAVKRGASDIHIEPFEKELRDSLSHRRCIISGYDTAQTYSRSTRIAY